ncbi:hypothetical protein IH992_34165 [Candidatus Poribacteria bacterium]|nr:hypothetical protein [Candidatus Poribacteria bacterium]
MGKKAKSKYGDKEPVSIAIKPGTYMEYLWNHPEEMRRVLKKHGVDADDDSTIGIINIGKKTDYPKKENT